MQPLSGLVRFCDQVPRVAPASQTAGLKDSIHSGLLKIGLSGRRRFHIHSTSGSRELATPELRLLRYLLLNSVFRILVTAQREFRPTGHLGKAALPWEVQRRRGNAALPTGIFGSHRRRKFRFRTNLNHLTPSLSSKERVNLSSAGRDFGQQNWPNEHPQTGKARLFSLLPRGQVRMRGPKRKFRFHSRGGAATPPYRFE
jgi:hypothetical protein